MESKRENMQTQNNIKTLAQTRSNNNTNKTFIQAMLDPNAEYGGLYTFCDIKPAAKALCVFCVKNRLVSETIRQNTILISLESTLE